MNIYGSFCEYFEYPMMTKILQNGRSGIYCVEIFSMLKVEKKYLICIVDNDVVTIGNKIPLANLEWVSIQTKILNNRYPGVDVHSYKPKNVGVINAGIKLVQTNGDTYIYECNNVNISVSVENKKMTALASNGTIKSALEMYNTVIVFLK